jgi:hypothetical protein
MKRILILFLVAIATVVILLFIYNPGLLDKLWLWIVGLIGAIVAVFQQGWIWIKKQIENIQNKALTKKNDHEPSKSENSKKSGTLDKSSETNQNITLLRLKNEDTSTLGILFYGEKFYCYTLEDFCSENSFHCRVPAGIYHLGFSGNSYLNNEYSMKINNFRGHLHLIDAPSDLNGIVHFGGLGNELKGDIILTDITENQNTTGFVDQSKSFYENFYRLVSNRIQNGEKVTFEIFDENWFKEKIN